MLKIWGFALVFQHLPQDLANVNEWKIMFDPYSVNDESTKMKHWKWPLPMWIRVWWQQHDIFLYYLLKFACHTVILLILPIHAASSFKCFPVFYVLNKVLPIVRPCCHAANLTNSSCQQHDIFLYCLLKFTLSYCWFYQFMLPAASNVSQSSMYWIKFFPLPCC